MREGWVLRLRGERGKQREKEGGRRKEGKEGREREKERKSR